MAKYSDQREQNRDIKYLHKIWSKVDGQVELPESLTGDALLPLLDKVPTHKPVSKEIRFSPKIFSWKSGVTYAAAFVLIVALSAMLGRGTSVPDDGDFRGSAIEPLPGAVDTDPIVAADFPEGEMDGDSQQPEASGQDIAASAPDNTAVPRSPVDAEASAGGASVPETDSGEPADSRTQAEGAGALAVGGQGASIELTRDDTYTYTYRRNDATDPGKSGYPSTVNIMHTATGVLVFEIDLPDMTSVERCLVNGGRVTLAGPSGDGAVTVRAYDLSLVGEARLLDTIRQPGSLLDARLYRTTVHVLTYLSAGDDPECDQVVLPGSTSQGMCVISALDMETMQINRMAFVGANDDAKLYNLNAYLQYEGEPTEDNETGAYVAHVRLDGIKMELRNDGEE